MREGPISSASDSDICLLLYVPFFTKNSFSISSSARALYGIIAGVVGGLLVVVIIIVVVIVIIAVRKKKKKKTRKMSEYNI